MAKDATSGVDFLGNTLEKNMLIAFSQADSSTMALGRIDGFTPTGGVRVTGIPLPHAPVTLGRWSRNKSIIRKSSQVVRLPLNNQELSELPASWIAKVFGGDAS